MLLQGTQKRGKEGERREGVPTSDRFHAMGREASAQQRERHKAKEEM